MPARSSRLTVGVAALVTLGLTGCAASAPETSPAETTGSGAFPVTVDSALGEAVIDSQPLRVATWGWGATDAVLALGIVPVAIPSDDYSGGDDRMAPWVAEKIEELGGEQPVILDNSTYELSVEELLATDPEVFLAPYSGLTQEEFDQVAAAGIPVVAYPEAAWTTPWRDVVSIVGAALGREDEAAAVLDDLDALVADAAAAHPEFAGTTIAVPTETAGTYYLYLQADPRVEILEDLGFVTPDSVSELDKGESTFYTTVSPETLDRIDAEVILTFAETTDALDAFLGSPAGGLIPAVQSGAVAALVGPEEVSSLSPTPLTLPWALDTITERLAEATAAARG
jgi:iron complex transport system substrate-binding protein